MSAVVLLKGQIQPDMIEDMKSSIAAVCRNRRTPW
jgi:hypothetical protein